MRAMRAILSGAVSLVLLVAWTTAVSAQEAADTMAPVYYTYTTELVVEEDEEDEVSPLAENVVRDHRQTEMVEATDPRASGLLTYDLDLDRLGMVDEQDLLIGALDSRLTNDGGAWTGTGRLVGRGMTDMAAIIVLAGEDGYEGLTLIMVNSDKAEAPYWGVIVPSDRVPPMPDPVEVPA